MNLQAHRCLQWCRPLLELVQGCRYWYLVRFGSGLENKNDGLSGLRFRSDMTWLQLVCCTYPVFCHCIFGGASVTEAQGLSKYDLTKGLSTSVDPTNDSSSAWVTSVSRVLWSISLVISIYILNYFGSHPVMHSHVYMFSQVSLHIYAPRFHTFLV